MPSPMKAINLTLLLLFVLANLHADETAKPKAKSKSKAPAASVVEPVENPPTGLESIGTMIPEGMRNLKVRIPGFDNGRPTSLVIADAMTRQDTNHLFAEGVVMHLYNAEPKNNIRVDLRSAIYHMDTKQMSSTERSKVSRSDFQIEGDSMTFDTITSHGTMTGHVHMVIFDLSSMSAPKEEPKVPKAIPVPAPTASTSPQPPATK